MDHDGIPELPFMMSIPTALGFTAIAPQDDVRYPASVINVASGHESDSNLDRELLDALEGSAIGAVGLGRIKLPRFDFWILQMCWKFGPMILDTLAWWLERA